MNYHLIVCNSGRQARSRFEEFIKTRNLSASEEVKITHRDLKVVLYNTSETYMFMTCANEQDLLKFSGMYFHYVTFDEGSTFSSNMVNTLVRRMHRGIMYSIYNKDS